MNCCTVLLVFVSQCISDKNPCSPHQEIRLDRRDIPVMGDYPTILITDKMGDYPTILLTDDMEQYINILITNNIQLF